MANARKTRNRRVDADRKPRGASTIAPMSLGVRGDVPPNPRGEVTRPITAGGGGTHRGDRRDMSATYTGNEKHAARGNAPRKDVRTRKR